MSVLKLRCFSFLPPFPPSISLHSFSLCPLSLCLCPPYSFLCLISFLGFDFPFCFQLGEEGIPTEELEADLGEHLAADAANCKLTVCCCNLPFYQREKNRLPAKTNNDSYFRREGWISHIYLPWRVHKPFILPGTGKCAQIPVCLFILPIIYRPKWHYCQQTPGTEATRG